MPTAPPQACPCGGLFDGVQCTGCNRKPRSHGWADDKRRGTRTQRGYDNRWLRLRAAKLRCDPLCEACLNKMPEIVTQATTVDHVVPFKGKADPKRLDWSNLQSLCTDCHEVKTVADRG